METNQITENEQEYLCLFPGYMAECKRYKNIRLENIERLDNYKRILSDFSRYISVRPRFTTPSIDNDYDDSVIIEPTEEGKKIQCSVCGLQFFERYELWYDDLIQWDDMDGFADDLMKFAELAKNSLVEIKADRIWTDPCAECCEEECENEYKYIHRVVCGNNIRDGYTYSHKECMPFVAYLS